MVSIGLDVFLGRLTGANVSVAFRRVISSVGLLLHKLGFNLTDSASNMIKAFKLLNDAEFDMTCRRRP